MLEDGREGRKTRCNKNMLLRGGLLHGEGCTPGTLWCEFWGSASAKKTLKAKAVIITSAAKCHEYHEIFTKRKNNEHIRGSLMLIA